MDHPSDQVPVDTPAEQNPKATRLAEMLDERIDSFQVRRKHNKGVAFRIQMMVTSLSALTTICLGLQLANHPTVVLYLRNFALCFSAAVTVFSAWEAFFDHKGLWIRYTQTRAQLLSIRAQLDYMTSGHKAVEDKEFDPLFDQYQSVLSQSSNSWLQLRSEQGKSKNG